MDREADTRVLDISSMIRAMAHVSEDRGAAVSVTARLIPASGDTAAVWRVTVQRQE